MICNEMIRNSIRVQKNIFNTTFNVVNSIMEHIETAVVINTPIQYKNQISSLHVLSETMKDKFNRSVNTGYDQMEALCAETL